MKNENKICKTRLMGLFIATIMTAAIFVPTSLSDITPPLPPVPWVGTVGNEFESSTMGYDECTDVVMDEQGNFYYVGIVGCEVEDTEVDMNPYDDPLQKDMRTINFTSDLFVTRLNSNGSYAWSILISAPTGWYGEKATCVTVDPDGNLLIAGIWGSVIVFQEELKLMLIAKINTSSCNENPNACIEWIRTLNSPESGGRHYCYPEDIVSDSKGNVIIVGHFSGKVDFDPSCSGQQIKESKWPYSDAFILRLNSNGLWDQTSFVRTFGLKYDDMGTGVATDIDDNIYAIGTVQEDFENNVIQLDSLPPVSLNESDAFVCRLNSTGLFEQFFVISGEYDDYGYDIYVEKDLKNELEPCVYYTGDVGGITTIDFNPNGGDLKELPKERNLFTTKLISLNANSIDYAWTNVVSSIRNDRKDFIKSHSIQVYSHRDVIVTGTFYGNIDFDPRDGEINNDTHKNIHHKWMTRRNMKKLESIPRAGDYTFITRYKADGDYDRTISFGGYLNGQAIKKGPRGKVIDEGWDFTFDPDLVIHPKTGRFLVGGSFTGKIDFDPDPHRSMDHVTFDLDGNKGALPQKIYILRLNQQ